MHEVFIIKTHKYVIEKLRVNKNDHSGIEFILK